MTNDINKNNEPVKACKLTVLVQDISTLLPHDIENDIKLKQILQAVQEVTSYDELEKGEAYAMVLLWQQLQQL